MTAPAPRPEPLARAATRVVRSAGAAAARAGRLGASRPWHLAASALACGLGLAPAGAAWVAVVAGVVAGVGAAARRAPLALVLCVLVLAGGATGAARLAAIDGRGAALTDGEPISGTAELVARPRAARFGSSAELRLCSGQAAGARLLARAPAWLRWPRAAEPGLVVAVRGRFTRPRRAAPGDFDARAHLRRRGLAGELRLDSVRSTGRRRGGAAGVVDGLRRRAERALDRSLPPGEAALLRGMVLGQDEAIAAAVRDDFRAAGLGHLLAVSGQNVMLLCALALPVLVAAGLGRSARIAGLLALVTLYVPLAGAGPSLQRAGVMGSAALVAAAASRPASRSYALALAAVVTLALNPRAAGEAGWQLSFAAVAGILWLAPPLRAALTEALDALGPQPAARPGGAPPVTAAGSRPAREAAPRPGAAAAAGPPCGPAAAAGSPRGPAAPAGPPCGPAAPVGPPCGPAAAVGPPRGPAAISSRARGLLRLGFVEGVAVTIAATLATAPLLAHHFGAVPLASLPANLLALPAVAPAMWAGMLLSALGQVPPLGPPLTPLAASACELVAWAARPAVAYLGRLAELFAASPGAQLRLPLGGTGALLASYAALVVGLVALGSTLRRAAPRAAELAAACRRLPLRARVALAALAAGAGALTAAAWFAPPAPPGRLTVSFLDVGQGDATLVQHPDGTAVLFDGGPPEGRVERLLRAAGVRRLSALVMTHASRDHHGGLPRLVQRYPPGLLLDGGDGTPDRSFRAVVAAARRRGARVVRALAPLRLRVGSLAIAVLAPPPRPPGPAPADPNPRAVVAVVSAGGFDLLLSADAESDALAPLPLPDVDAMKVPHHGSADPGLPAILRRVRPELAAIEVGENGYGHPAASTLSALRSARVPTFRTDRDGTVSLRIERGGMSVATER